MFDLHFYLSLLCVLLVGILFGMLSPIVTLTQRSYSGDTLTHLMIPGFLLGDLLAKLFAIPPWTGWLMGALGFGILGNLLITFIQRMWRVSVDVATTVSLGVCLSLVVTVFKHGGDTQNIEDLMMGSIDQISPGRLWALLVLNGIILGLVFGLRRHWDAWVCDPEFAQLQGFRVGLVRTLFPLLITAGVCGGLLTVGGLSVASLLTLPSLVKKPKSVFYIPTLLWSVVLSCTGFAVAMAFSIPVGSATMLFGFAVVFLMKLRVH